MEKQNLSAITLTILTESSVALSNDQGFGNYTPIKKCFINDGVHGMTSVGTITYEMRKALGKKGWRLSGIVLNGTKKDNVKNIYADIKDIEAEDEKALETDVFGFLIPDKQLSKTSPLRIIPFKSMHIFRNDTQLITNRGFLDKDFGREYFYKEGKNCPIDELPKTQALASEEVLGDYYVYTVTIELDRLGVLEVKDGKYLEPNERIYMDKGLREKALKDIVDVIVELTRTIKHQTVHLKPLAVFGGAFSNVIPYFWDDVQMDAYNNLVIDNVVETVRSYGLDKENYIATYSGRLNAVTDKCNEKEANEIVLKGYPVVEIKNLVDKLYLGEDNKWYLKAVKEEKENE